MATKAIQPWAWPPNVASAAEDGRWSAVQGVRGSETKPYPPRGLRTANGTQKVTLTWDVPEKNADQIAQWRIYMDTETNQIAVVRDPSVTTYDVQVKDTLVHNFFVVGVNALGKTSIFVRTTAQAAAINLDNVADGTTFKRILYVNGDHTFHVSSALTPQGSVVGMSENSFSYTATATSITWSWTAFTIYFPDGSTISVPLGTQTFSGLTAGTLYYFGFYFDVNAGIAKVVLSDVSAGAAPESLNQVANVINSDRAIPININVKATAAGGGGGGGGGQCFTPNTRILAGRGVVSIAEIQVGELVLTDHGYRKVREVFVHLFDGELRSMGIHDGLHEGVTEDHLLKDSCEGWVAAMRKFLTTFFYRGNVHNLEIDTDDPDEHNYCLGNGEVAHNLKYQG